MTNDIYNPLALTDCCKYGVAIFDEPDDENSYSPNVAYELGVMQAQDKKCFVIQHESLKGKEFF